MSDHTPTPWHWAIEDISTATLQGPRGSDGGDHVLSVSPCESCLEYAKKNNHDDWKWGRCTTPTEANAAFIVRAINAHDDLVAALRTVAGQHALFVGPDNDIANATKEVVHAALVKAGAL